MIYLDDRVPHPAAAGVRRSIALKAQRIGEAVLSGASDVAIRQLIDDFRSFEQLNKQFLRPTWPLPRGYRSV
jgi:hypothetical protein